MCLFKKKKAPRKLWVQAICLTSRSWGHTWLMAATAELGVPRVEQGWASPSRGPAGRGKPMLPPRGCPGRGGLRCLGALDSFLLQSPAAATGGHRGRHGVRGGHSRRAWGGASLGSLSRGAFLDFCWAEPLQPDDPDALDAPSAGRAGTCFCVPRCWWHVCPERPGSPQPQPGLLSTPAPPCCQGRGPPPVTPPCSPGTPPRLWTMGGWPRPPSHPGGPGVSCTSQSTRDKVVF